MFAICFLLCFAIVSWTSGVPSANSTLERGRTLSKRSLEMWGSCHFDDHILVDSLDRSAFQIKKLDRNWSVDPNNKVPRISYFFHSSVKKMDKKVIKAAMKIISGKTCIIFNLVQENNENNAPLHHLEIVIKTQTQFCESNGGVVKSVDGSGGKVKMSFDYSFRCGQKPWEINLVLHELGHVLGLAHTHRRPDRENFVNINQKCIKEKERPQFSPLKWNEAETCDVPYKCNSMMHYKANVFSNGCDTFSAKPGKCEEGIGGKEPIKEDWDLINRIHCIICAGPHAGPQCC